MRILPPLFCVLLLVSGVLGVEMKDVTLSVMMGDTVTLKPDDAVIPTNERILWKFEGSIIVNVKNLKDGDFTYDGRFKEKLLLDKQTGSLTITDLTTDKTGLYRLEILSTTEITKNYRVTVHDVVESVSVMVGDSVTLHTGVKVQGDDQKLWKFGDQGTIIASLTLNVSEQLGTSDGLKIVNGLNGTVDGRWTNFHLSGQTGELTIINIQSDQTGVYKMKINTNSMILQREFSIKISDEMNRVSVKEGESVTLRTGLNEIKGNDLTWKSEDHLMAERDRKTNRFSIYNSDDRRFKGRLQTNENTGSLTISKAKTTDSGDYYLNMSSTAFSLQRTISVTVSAPSDAASGICGAGVGLIVWAVAVFLLQEV